MRWVGFNFPAAFGAEQWSVRYWALIEDIRTARRAELLPAEAGHPRAGEPYYRLALGKLRRRPDPILSRRRRRIVFIPSVWHKFVSALEINDLHHGSPIEDRLWAAFKQEGIEAERQWFEGKGETLYCLDFALFCPQRNIDVECDGDAWHANPTRARLDNGRNNYLERGGWHVLRFTGTQITDRLDHCVRDVRTIISRCGGLFLADGMLREFKSEGVAHRPQSVPSWTFPSATAPGMTTSDPGRGQPPERRNDLDLAPLLALRQAKQRREDLAALRARHGDQALVAALADALASLSPDRRARVVWCLGELPPGAAVVELLVATLPAEPCEKVRRLMYTAFAKCPSRSPEEAILGRLQEEQGPVLVEALRALKVCGSRQSVAPLLRLLGRPQPGTVARAARAALRCCAGR
jgi:very-short-patch-repair endonuclease